jgi:hypothetical protein
LRVLVLGIPLSADGVRRDNHEMRLGRVQCGVTIAARKGTCDPDSSSYRRSRVALDFDFMVFGSKSLTDFKIRDE